MHLGYMRRRQLQDQHAPGLYEEEAGTGPACTWVICRRRQVEDQHAPGLYEEEAGTGTFFRLCETQTL